VDAPVLAKRASEKVGKKFELPEGLDLPNVSSPFGDGSTNAAVAVRTYNFGGRDSSNSWESVIPWVKKNTKLEIWLKGSKCPSFRELKTDSDLAIIVYCAEDVQRAIHYGLDGVIVSNHGGRQLDGVPATIEALPECVDAAHGRIKVAIDGGIRRGSDIFKALALGADYCFMGRVPIWGLAVSIGDSKLVIVLTRTS
jgi:(S)-2-hydroxy-acid oxidase